MANKLPASMLEQPITVPTPSAPGHAANKEYVDGLAANLGKRGRVRAATTANITIATALNNGDTLDGVTLATGDQILVKNQTAPAENGVWIVSVTPARAAEFDAYDEHPGSLIAVEEGTINADTLWLCTSNVGGTLGTTAIAFSAFSVTSPTFVGFSAYKSADQTGIAAATHTKLTFNTEEYDQGGYYDTSNSRFTPPAGFYSIKAGWTCSAGAVDQSDIQIHLYKNGSAYRGSLAVNASGTGPQGANIVVDVQASGSDYFEIYVRASGTGTKTALSGLAWGTYFQAHKIG